MEKQQVREKLGSRLGFILLSAGCAIGVGNVWKFPWMVGQYGGGLFVLLYLAFLVVMGVPVMTMEFSLGRASQKSPAKLYQALEKPGQKWHAHGYAAFVGNIILMMFYTSVTAWILIYFVKTLKGDFVGHNSVEVSSMFGGMLSDPWILILVVGIVCALGILVCSLGVKKSLERVTKVLMVALLVIMVAVAIKGLFLDGAKEGLKFYLVPNFDIMKEVGIFTIITGAMSQAFFTVSLGIGSMAIFGSYLNKDRSLFGESVNIAILDTFVAFVSGLIIFPACFTYNNGQVGAGPSLIFETIPNIFNNMPGGRIWGALFFIFLAFAALSTVFAVFENIFACAQDLFGMPRVKTCIIFGIGLFVLAIPCILGFNVLSNVTFGKLGDIMGLEDYIVSNVLLPVGSLIFVLFCTLKKGWGYDNFIEEANQGKGLKIKSWMEKYFKYVLPILIVIFTVITIITPFIG